MRTFSILLFIVLVCMAIICGCSVPSSSSSQPAAPASQPAAVQPAAPVSGGPAATISIIASSFDPAILNIKAGTTVTWVNEDKISHRVEHLPELPGDKLLFRSESLSPGESFSYTFSQAGRYEYGDPQHAGGRTFLVIVG
jgi:plastocyanin